MTDQKNVFFFRKNKTKDTDKIPNCIISSKERHFYFKETHNLQKIELFL